MSNEEFHQEQKEILSQPEPLIPRTIDPSEELCGEYRHACNTLIEERDSLQSELKMVKAELKAVNESRDADCIYYEEITRSYKELKAVKAERDALKRDLEHYERFACKTCGGSGYVGSPPDDYYSCPECNVPIQEMADELKKLKAERDALAEKAGWFEAKHEDLAGRLPQIQAKAILEAIQHSEEETIVLDDWVLKNDLEAHAQNILDKAGE